jgi:uncharacterized 2Fe-2S/4Fe-4S cluster protein (DUF4445 family)
LSYTIDFEPVGWRGPCPEGGTLLDAARALGADHVAMLLATGMADRTDTALAIDIGTNTEMCLAHHGQMTSLSCASGPAFEGAHTALHADFCRGDVHVKR